jgi:hypothetical protein
MATVPVDPLQLTEEATLNGTILVDLLGANPAWVGRSAHSLLSSGARESSEAERRSFGRALGPSWRHSPLTSPSVAERAPKASLNRTGDL